MPNKMRPRRSQSVGREDCKAVESSQSSPRPSTDSDLQSASIHDRKSFDTQSSACSSTKPLPRHELRRFGWWWELGAIVVSLVSITLIMAILLAMDGKPLQHWRLPIQINSLVAVFSTFTRSALLLVVAEGLSQLKWNYFEKQASTLDRLQLFDDASRGPWGALMFLFKITKREACSLAAIGSALTVLALALEPFMQQILEFPSQKTFLTDGSAYLRTADAFDLREWPPSTETGGTKLTMLLNLLELLLNSSTTIDSPFECPTGDCEMPAHWSLAACTECENTITSQDPLNCTYRYFKSDKSELNLEEFKTLAIASGATEYAGELDHPNNLIAQCWIARDHGISAKMNSATFDIWDITKPFVNEQDALWGDGNAEEEPFNFNNNDIASINYTVFGGFPKYEDLAQWSGVIRNITSCTIRYCVKETASAVLKKGRIQRNDLYEELPLTFSNPCGTDTKCPNITATFQQHSNETLNIQLDSESRLHFGDVVAEILQGVVGGFSYTEDYFAEINVKDLAEMMGTTISSFMRSSQNTRATNMTGKAIVMETYVRVKWEWAIFPFIIVLGSVIFLILTILDSRSGEQLFKSSVLIGFFVRWEGAPESRLGIDRQYHYRDVLQEGKESCVRLIKNEDGEILFVSTKS